jgi:hypothetical protein
MSSFQSALAKVILSFHLTVPDFVIRTAEEHGMVCSLALAWGLTDRRQLALQTLEYELIPRSDHARRFVFAHKYGIAHWALPALRALLTRTTPPGNCELEALSTLGPDCADVILWTRMQVQSQFVTVDELAALVERVALTPLAPHRRDMDNLERRIREAGLLPPVDDWADEECAALDADLEDMILERGLSRLSTTDNTSSWSHSE